MTICHAKQEDEKELVFKFGFVGEYGRTPKRNFLKEVPLWTLLKNFQKGLFINVF